ncbi:MAG: hypothetical protein U5K56_02570 [Halioglobus sp.]|nr:hypothetical protein [Halioglobus sp.]
MSATKIAMLVIYAVLAALALTVSGPVGTWSLAILAVLAVAHAIETVVFYRLCERAGGSLPLHLLNVFLFGVLHVKELKARGAG